ncbi:carotenoid oxygenase family protein [Hyphomonas sp. FCG-A18]|uniref:carotenoid oxygenase family protein n=1 Tax=Hyphomonas sp. FCG-A18 TaxID=3080019 RepID=UPI002B291396|nr:carotenoid oxygenase family protein [Hyphomonas sp. FCG-A18]
MTLSRRHFLGATAAATSFTGLGLTPAFGQTKTIPDWHLGYANAPAQGFGPAPLRLVYGKAPKGLQGNLYRNGPAQFLYGQDDYIGHWFDGDGMVQRIAIGDGQAIHTGRFVDTNKRQVELAANKVMASGFGTAGHPDFAVMGPDDVNAANTSVMVVNGELLALWEAGSAIAMDAETLDTKGPKVWRDDLTAMPFLAHPKREPDGTVWNLAVAGPNVGVYKIGKDGVLRDFGLLNMGIASYVHDWAMTERHLIIMVQPWINEALRPPVVEGFEWRPEEGFKFLIVDKDDFSKQRWAQGPARAFFHTGAAWEEADGTIRIDAALYKEPVLGAGGGLEEIRGEWAGRDGSMVSDLTQIVIPVKGDARLVETGLDGEFPQVDPRLHGLPRRLTALVTGPSAKTPGSTSLSVHNWDSGQTDTFDFGDTLMVEEFLFVPKPGSTREEDSWLIGPVLNLKTRTTDICVFDAARVSDGPVCIWRADYAWPLGFHGTWA